ncbi:MAG: serine hydrolase [Sinobacteraceae bacterium]|nr:serine hydrolase [Nevskiaceae bacterium]
MTHSARFASVLPIVLSLLVASAAAGPSTYSAADEAVYLERFGRLMDAARLGLGLETYEPLEPVPGVRKPMPLAEAAAGSGRIAPAALQAASDYAARNNSSAFMVWHEGKVEKASFFKGMKPEDTFPSRSLAKPMTAVAIGRALALGKIRSLDQPVADFVTEWRGDPRRSRILVRHLLDMRSGFLPQAAATTAEDMLNRAYLHPRHEDIIIRDYPVVDEPGSRYEYNNATSEMVAVLIERATGVRYGEWLSREVLQRIGSPGGTIWVNRPGGTAHSGCCLMLPAEAWLRLGVLLMQDGVWEGKRLLPAGYVQAMRTPTAENPYYGLGVYVAGRYIARRGFANPARDTEARRVLHSEPYLADDLFLFDGNSNQVVFIIPSRRLVVLRVGDTPPRGAGAEWDNSALPNLLLRGLPEGGSPQPR